MLRKILIALGILVALVPYLGFPSAYDTVLLTGLGLSIVGLIVLGKRPRVRRDVRDETTELPRGLHVEHHEVEERPQMHVERDVVTDVERIDEDTEGETVVERQVSVVRRRRKKALPGEEGGGV